MLFAPANDIRIDLADGSYIILKSIDSGPAISFPEYSVSGLYKDGVLQYMLPVKNSHYCNYVYDSSGHHFVQINHSADTPKSVIFYKDGVVVNEINFSQLGVPKILVPVTSGGWYRHWGGFESGSSPNYSISIDKIQYYIFGITIPITGRGKIEVDLDRDIYHIHTPVNYLLWFCVIAASLFSAFILMKVIKRRSD